MARAQSPELNLTLGLFLSSAIVIGSPPLYRGGPKPGQDLELQLLKHFPDIAMFVEKPVATGAYLSRTSRARPVCLTPTLRLTQNSIFTSRNTL